MDELDRWLDEEEEFEIQRIREKIEELKLGKITCPICGTDDVYKFIDGSWMLRGAPLPHYSCVNRHIFSGDLVHIENCSNVGENGICYHSDAGKLLKLYSCEEIVENNRCPRGL